HSAARLTVEPPEGVVILRAEFGPPDVLDTDDGPGRRLANDDVLELFGRHQASRHAERLGELLILWRGGCADLAGRGLDVLLFDRRDDIRRGQAELGRAVGTYPYAHPIIGPAKEVNL